MIEDEIIKLIKQDIHDQTKLLTELKELGYRTTQSSISRKLAKLGIKKINGRYFIQDSQPRFKFEIRFAKPNLFIIRTKPGDASSLAALIDDKLVSSDQYSEFLGTIAGDDTIFIAVNIIEQDFHKTQKILELLLS